MFSLASIVHRLFDTIRGLALSLLALDEGQNLEDQLLSCSPSVYTAVGNRQALHFAILETVCFSHARKLIYLPATLNVTRFAIALTSRARAHVHMPKRTMGGVDQVRIKDR